MFSHFPKIATVCLIVSWSQTATAANQVQMTVEDGQRCFVANGIPDHATGAFPTRGNPHAIATQEIAVCVPATPRKARRTTEVQGIMGIAVNGVPFRPNTAEYFDPKSRHGFSRRGDQNWSLDIHGAPGRLGLDFNNAHVGHGGVYHYHGIATSLTQTSGSTLVGYAGDGYEIHYIPSVQSSWQLKEGLRPNGPGGAYDGTYNEDYEFAEARGDLDQCNGGVYGDRYVYFITESYPFVPRCLVGQVSSDFKGRHR